MDERTDSTERAVEAFRGLLQVLKRLRAPGGCPWDRKQTERSMAPLLLEEAFEAVDAVTAGRDEDAAEELGDLAMNLFLTCVIAEERGAYDAADVLEGITRKLVFRHPHVFEKRERLEVEGVLHRWEALKRREREEKQADPSAVAGVPRALPALLRGVRLLSRMARVRPDLPFLETDTERLSGRVGAPAALEGGGEAEAEAWIASLLLDVVNLCRLKGVDPETALRARLAHLEGAFRKLEARLGPELASLPAEEVRRAWRGILESEGTG